MARHEDCGSRMFFDFCRLFMYSELCHSTRSAVRRSVYATFRHTMYTIDQKVTAPAVFDSPTVNPASECVSPDVFAFLTRTRNAADFYSPHPTGRAQTGPSRNDSCLREAMVAPLSIPPIRKTVNLTPQDESRAFFGSRILLSSPYDKDGEPESRHTSAGSSGSCLLLQLE